MTNLAVQLKPNKKVGVRGVKVGVRGVKPKPKLKRKVSDAENAEGVEPKPKLIGVKREVSDTENTEGVEVFKVEPQEHKFGHLATKFLNMLMNEEKRKRNIDLVFGIRKDDNSWKIGKKE